MTNDSQAKQHLVSRLVEATGEGLIVKAAFMGMDGVYEINKPQTLNGVLTFVTQNGNTARVLESAIVAIFEIEDIYID